MACYLCCHSNRQYLRYVSRVLQVITTTIDQSALCLPCLSNIFSITERAIEPQVLRAHEWSLIRNRNISQVCKGILAIVIQGKTLSPCLFLLCSQLIWSFRRFFIELQFCCCSLRNDQDCCEPVSRKCRINSLGAITKANTSVGNANIFYSKVTKIYHCKMAFQKDLTAQDKKELILVTELQLQQQCTHKKPHKLSIFLFFDSLFRVRYVCLRDDYNFDKTMFAPLKKTEVQKGLQKKGLVLTYFFVRLISLTFRTI